MEGTLLRTFTVPLALGLVLAGCVSTDDYNRALRANDHLQTALADLADYQTKLDEENTRLSENLIRVGRDAADAEWIKVQKEKLDRLLAEFQNGSLRAAEGVTLKSTPEGLAFQVEGEVLFESGEVAVTDRGEEILRSLIPTLQTASRIRVDGHTDTDPILRSGHQSNLELSAKRAVAVAHFLIANGMPAEGVAIGGFGEHRPAVSENTPEAKRANRRVEILMVDG